MLFRWRGRINGEIRSGQLDANDMRNAQTVLEGQGVVLLALDQADAGTGSAGEFEWPDWMPLLGRKKVEIEELIIFSRQMCALSKAGVPLISALNSLSVSSRSKVLAADLRLVIERVESGVSLATAMRQSPETFNSLFVSMVHVGENTGHLEEAFKQTGQYLELDRETRKRIKSATRYPLMVIMAMAVALAIISLWVIPAFARVFQRFKAELPWPTQVLIWISDFVLHYWWVLALLVGLLVYGLRQWLATPHGQLAWGRWQIRLPVLGPIYLMSSLARFARCFAMLYRAGVPVLQALNVVSYTLDNEYIARAVREMQSHVESGESVTRAAAGAGMFTPLVLQMLMVGEDSGSLDEMMLEVAGFYENEVDYDIKRMADNMEPLLLAALGVLVLIMALGVFLPMWDLGTAMRH